MENGYGGPVWHASVAWHDARGLRPVMLLTDTQRNEMWRVAGGALVGVGSILLGQWREKLERSLHVKRRLTPDEWGERPWGMDYRGTPEGRERLEHITQWLPPQMREALMSEVLA
jgi:hypothetical protein